MENTTTVTLKYNSLENESLKKKLRWTKKVKWKSKKKTNYYFKKSKEDIQVSSSKSKIVIKSSEASKFSPRGNSNEKLLPSFHCG